MASRGINRLDRFLFMSIPFDRCFIQTVPLASSSAHSASVKSRERVWNSVAGRGRVVKGTGAGLRRDGRGVGDDRHRDGARAGEQTRRHDDDAHREQQREEEAPIHLEVVQRGNRAPGRNPRRGRDGSARCASPRATRHAALHASRAPRWRSANRSDDTGTPPAAAARGAPDLPPPLINT